MKQSRIISLLFCAFFFFSCFFDSGKDRIIGKYYVLWIDLVANQTISEQSGQSASSYSVLVPEYVFTVGHNDRCIIAKQHPTSGFENGYVVDTAITNYYIINLGEEAKEKVIGPLNINEFEEMKKIFEIENLDFDLNYPETP